MTVYKLIQELAQCNANAEVIFDAKIEYSDNLPATFDRDDENDEQDVLVDINFRDCLEFDEIRDSLDEVTIKLCY